MARRPNSASIGAVLGRAVAVQVGLLAATAVVVVSAVVGYRSLVERAEVSAAVLNRVELVLTDVLNAETSLRGYGLVRREEFLEPYREAFPHLEAELSEIEDTGLAGDPRIDQIRTIIEEWRVEFAEPAIRAVSDDRQDDAAAIFESGQGKVRIDEVRRLAADLSADVAAEGEEHSGQAEVVGILAIVAALSAPVAAVGLGITLRRRLHHQVAVPIALLAEAAGRFGEGDLSTRAEAGQVEELVKVALAFNEMAAGLERTVTDLRSVDRLKSEFVSVVSHELRTPLTSIRGSLGLLAAGAFGAMPSEADAMLGIAVSNTDRLIRLINDILDLERIDAGLDTIDARPCDVASLMSEAADGARGLCEAAGIKLVVWSVDAELVVDRDRIVQCLTNLLANAIKFSPASGHVLLIGELHEGEVLLRVSDGGRGIPADKLESIFERFGQVDASDARDKGGTGLGLAIVKTIADQHGGRIEVVSDPGVHTTFTLALPTSGSVALDPLPRLEGPERDHPVVLLVEDDHDLSQIIRTLLARHGIHVVAATGAAEAVQLAVTVGPDLLVLDVRLSEGDGYEVVRRLRADDRLRSIPTIVFTVHDLGRAQQNRLRLGETVFVSKGRHANELFESQVLDLLARSGPAGGAGHLVGDGPDVEPSPT